MTPMDSSMNEEDIQNELVQAIESHGGMDVATSDEERNDPVGENDEAYLKNSDSSE